MWFSRGEQYGSQSITAMSHECHGISNHHQIDCLFNSEVSSSSKTASNLPITAPLWGNPEVTGRFPWHRDNDTESISHDVVVVFMSDKFMKSMHSTGADGYSNFAHYLIIIIYIWQTEHMACSVMVNIGSDAGLLPGQNQAITIPNDHILPTAPHWTSFSETWVIDHKFSFTKFIPKCHQQDVKDACKFLVSLYTFTKQGIEVPIWCLEGQFIR